MPYARKKPPAIGVRRTIPVSLNRRWRLRSRKCRQASVGFMRSSATATGSSFTSSTIAGLLAWMITVSLRAALGLSVKVDSGMTKDFQHQIEEEIVRVKGEIDAQKRLIKKSLGKKLVIETAELEMRALHTRLAVLEANLAKHGGG